MYTPTQAYFDTTGTLTIVTGRGTLLHTEPVPLNILMAEQPEQERWIMERVGTKSHRVQGQARDYPYGFLFNLKRLPTANTNK